MSALNVLALALGWAAMIAGGLYLVLWAVWWCIERSLRALGVYRDFFGWMCNRIKARVDRRRGSDVRAA